MKKLLVAVILIIASTLSSFAHEIGYQHQHHSETNWVAIIILAVIVLAAIAIMIYKIAKKSTNN